MIDQGLLSDTLQKINASLNKRFEKDADLYISKQDEYEIKKNLCNGAYGGVVNMAMAKGISHDIVLKVILRNAGVFDVKDIKEFRKTLKPIFEDADYKALSYMMEDVLNSNTYMQKKVKKVFFKYYVNGIPASQRVRYWKSERFDFNIDERTELFNSILTKVNHRDPSQTFQYRLDFARDAFQHHPEIMKDKYVYCKLKDSLEPSDQVKFFKHLCEEMESPFITSDMYNFVLVEAYASYGEKAFNDAVNQIKATSARNYKLYIKVINKLLLKEKDKDILIRMFDTIVRVFDSPYIKGHVRREISAKTWKELKKNEILYSEKKLQIDKLLSEVEKIDKDKYKSFSDVANAVKDNVNPKSIAFFWVNIKSPIFEESIVDSFSGISNEYKLTMKEVYSWLFDHSIRKGGVGELTKMCEKVAIALHNYNSSEEKSMFYDILDEIWLNYVIQYKPRKNVIKDYMCEAHFDRAKELGY